MDARYSLRWWVSGRIFAFLLLQVLFYFRQRKFIPQKSDKAIFFRVEGKKAIFTCWITAWGKKKTKYGPDYDHSD